MAQSEAPVQAPKRVLIARFSAIGDVAMTIPVIYSACLTYPDTQFTLITRASMVNLFVNRPPNLQVDHIDPNGSHEGAMGVYRLVKQLHQKYNPEVFIDLHDVIRTKAMRLFGRLRGWRIYKFNKGRSNKRALTRSANKVMLPLVSSIDRYRSAFFKGGMPLNPLFQGLYGPGGKSAPAEFAKITEPKPAGLKWVGIAPFAAHPGKIYPPEKMEEVIRTLCNRGDCRIFIFGAGGYEAETAQQWAGKYPQVTSLCGKRYGFPAEMALMSHFDVMLSMDSANMHLAAIVGIPTVSIWGATHHYCGFTGWHQSESDMVQVPLPCRPCSVFGDKKCNRGDLLCLNAIRPDAVYRKLCEKLDK